MNKADTLKWRDKTRAIAIFLVAIVLLFSCLFGFYYNADADNDRVLRVGYIDVQGLVINDGDEYWGYAVEYLNKIAQYTGWEYEYIPVDIKNGIEMLQLGELDMLLPCEYTKERAKAVDYSAMSMGSHFLTISARKNDKRFDYGDIEAIDGCTVGFLDTQLRNVQISDFTDRMDISVIKKPYADIQALTEALDSGEVDLVLCSDEKYATTTNRVFNIEVMPVYIAMKKGDNSIKENLDTAVQEILTANINYNSYLYNKYYGQEALEAELLNDNEKEYLEKNPAVKIGVETDKSGISAYKDPETGELRGIYIDLVKLIAEKAGFQPVFVEYGDCQTSWDDIARGKIDVKLVLYSYDELEEKYNVSKCYGSAVQPMSLVCHQGDDFDLGDENIVALPKGSWGIEAFINNNYPKSRVAFFDDKQACYKAVEDGLADYLIENAWNLQVSGELYKHPKLVCISDNELSMDISCVVSNLSDPALMGIINKTTARITEDEINSIVFENTVSKDYKMDIVQFLKNNVGLIVILICVVFLIVVFAIKIRELHFYRLALFDSLTGVWNKEKFIKEANSLLINRKGERFAVITMDVDKFKYINDNFGYELGDDVLKQISQDLRTVVEGKKCLYARIVADNFGILVEDTNGMVDSIISRGIIYAERYLNVKNDVKISLKFGVCKFTASNKGVLEYIDRANIAKKKIKGLRDLHVGYFDDELEKDLQRELWIEQNMDKALLNGEFKVFYQPKYRLTDGKIVGAEALSRWVSKNGEMISPVEFVPIFENNGFISDLDFYVYEKVGEFIRNQIRFCKNVVPISVNVSKVDFQRNDFVPRMFELIEKYDLPQGYIELELTEYALATSVVDINEKLDKLREGGFLISIDDFGSGYSSLNLLKEIPVDVVKIDRGFLQETENSEKSKTIIRTVIELSKNIGISTVCEGVETNEQSEFLQDAGCDMVQGFLMSKPVTENEFRYMLSEKQDFYEK